MVNYDSFPASFIYDTRFKELGPISNLPFVVITGVTYEDCTDEGFPTPAEFDRLENVFNVLEKRIDHWSSSYVGVFTHRCQRLGYFYVMDTTGLRDSLKQLYADQFPLYSPYINMRADKDWETYFKFLVPTPQIVQSNSNFEVLVQLFEAGDSLVLPRNVDHWIYFRTEKDRKGFKSAAIDLGFAATSEAPLPDADPAYPHGLRLSRIDHVDHQAIDSVTFQLIDLAQKWNGKYDGWEAEVIKSQK